MAKIFKNSIFNGLFRRYFFQQQRFLVFILAGTVIFTLFAGTHIDNEGDLVKFDMERSNAWVDSVFKTLDEEQRIGQLFMVAAYSNRGPEHTQNITKLITNCHIGGLIFFQGGPGRQAALTNYYQSLAQIPLLISIDGEWGLAMRLDSTTQFPHQMTLGAIQDDKMVYRFGQEMARQCKRLGIHINLAPVVDVNNNPRNPVINDRSFGEDKYNVAGKSIAYMQGMQDGGIMANAKHFPGHGNTDKDSHKTLPTVNRTRLEIDSIELYPFRQLMNRGLSSVMVAHLYVPALDSTTNVASTLSKSVVTNLLKNDLHYTGLVFTDALNMKGVSAYYPPGIVDVKALLAGNDVLLFSEDVPIAIYEIRKAIAEGKITQAEIDIRVKKILKAKYLAGLNNYRPIDLRNLYSDLNNSKTELLNRRLFESSLTILRNKNNTIPVSGSADKVAGLSIGMSADNEFLNGLKLYENIPTYTIDKGSQLTDLDYVESELARYETVIIGLHSLSPKESKNFGVTPQIKAFINRIEERAKVILVIFGNPYSLRNFENIEPIIVAYEDNAYTRNAAAQVVFGGMGANGKLPVTASEVFKCGDGFSINNAIRFKYVVPEEVKMNATKLSEIDSIANEAINRGAMPGCQILVAKDGRIVYHKSFGKHASTDTTLVDNFDLYDVASVTKVAATTLAMMKLYELGRVDLDKKISHYLENRKLGNKKGIIISDLLTHQAGLKPFIPFWKTSLEKEGTQYINYRITPSAAFSVKVADKMYLRTDYIDQIWKEIIDSKVENQGSYVYSDLDFYFLKEIVETEAQMKLNEYVSKQYYGPLGITRTAFMPLNKFPLNQIIPTENDQDFRKQLIRGYVHDQGAAMLGGVGGHAGLFSTAYDMAVIMQMLLNNGTYGGKRYLKPETVQKFTTTASITSRRGLGFDKPEANGAKGSPTCKSASPLTFGHTGFTGTCVWADPKYNLVYVFLSNRINPNAENKKLVDLNVRTNIQQVVYDAFLK